MLPSIVREDPVKERVPKGYASFPSPETTNGLDPAFKVRLGVELVVVKAPSKAMPSGPMMLVPTDITIGEDIVTDGDEEDATDAVMMSPSNVRFEEIILTDPKG
jgi:hypothetical protein